MGGLNDRREGKNVILDPNTDDAKSIPPVMQKPYIALSHTLTHFDTQANTCMLGSPRH